MAEISQVAMLACFLSFFKTDSASIDEEFAKNDPYVRNGLVARWRVRQWMTVVGDLATTPVRPT
jgi:uncharacterized protein